MTRGTGAPSPGRRCCRRQRAASRPCLHLQPGFALQIDESHRLRWSVLPLLGR
uniref:Uncharacterized protein n=1 Tax=Arundo donax TaxID=35708 RepID=A0A0A9A553_ARUDO